MASPPLIKRHPELFASRNTITARLWPEFDDSSSSPIIIFTCRTDAACYEMDDLADIPNRYPYSTCTEKKSYVTPCVGSDNQLYAVVDVGYEGQDTADAANHDKWLSENNFFQYLSEKNEWILLPPMPKVGRYVLMDQQCFIWKNTYM